MNYNTSLKNLHIGTIIKEIAQQKGISSKQIAAVIRRYETNSDKIFKVTDMDIEDIVSISYLLEYNILEFLVKQYFVHFSSTEYITADESCLFKIDMRTQRITNYETFNNCDFLKEIYIGKHIREIAEKQGYSGQDMAKQLHCAQSVVSDLYKRKSLNVKTIITISNLLHYNFIAELYLSQMVIVSSWNKFDNCIITITQQQVRILNPNSNSPVMVFQRNDDKKQKCNRKKTESEP